jgi:predicted DNA-binding protein
MTARITITLPDALLAELDKLAEAEGLSRSGIVREASAHYVAGALDEVAAERRRRAVEHTLATLDELRRAPVLDDRPSLEILREIRGPLGADLRERKE